MGLTTSSSTRLVPQQPVAPQPVLTTSFSTRPAQVLRVVLRTGSRFWSTSTQVLARLARSRSVVPTSSTSTRGPSRRGRLRPASTTWFSTRRGSVGLVGLRLGLRLSPISTPGSARREVSRSGSTTSCSTRQATDELARSPLVSRHSPMLIWGSVVRARLRPVSQRSSTRILASPMLRVLVLGRVLVSSLAQASLMSLVSVPGRGRRSIRGQGSRMLPGSQRVSRSSSVVPAVSSTRQVSLTLPVSVRASTSSRMLIPVPRISQASGLVLEPARRTGLGLRMSRLLVLVLIRRSSAGPDSLMLLASRLASRSRLMSIVASLMRLRSASDRPLSSMSIRGSLTLPRLRAGQPTSFSTRRALVLSGRSRLGLISRLTHVPGSPMWRRSEVARMLPSQPRLAQPLLERLVVVPTLTSHPRRAPGLLVRLVLGHGLRSSSAVASRTQLQSALVPMSMLMSTVGSVELVLSRLVRRSGRRSPRRPVLVSQVMTGSVLMRSLMSTPVSVSLGRLLVVRTRVFLPGRVSRMSLVSRPGRTRVLSRREASQPPLVSARALRRSPMLMPVQESSGLQGRVRPLSRSTRAATRTLLVLLREPSGLFSTRPVLGSSAPSRPVAILLSRLRAATQPLRRSVQVSRLRSRPRQAMASLGRLGLARMSLSHPRLVTAMRQLKPLVLVLRSSRRLDSARLERTVQALPLTNTSTSRPGSPLRTVTVTVRARTGLHVPAMPSCLRSRPVSKRLFICGQGSPKLALTRRGVVKVTRNAPDSQMLLAAGSVPLRVSPRRLALRMWGRQPLVLRRMSGCRSSSPVTQSQARLFPVTGCVNGAAAATPSQVSPRRATATSSSPVTATRSSKEPGAASATSNSDGPATALSELSRPVTASTGSSTTRPVRLDSSVPRRLDCSPRHSRQTWPRRSQTDSLTAHAASSRKHSSEPWKGTR